MKEMDKEYTGEGNLTDEQEIYRENILDHYKHPRNTGSLQQYSIRHRELNPLCGDEIELFIALEDDAIIADVSFIGKGCAISQAAMSMISEDIKGRPLQDVLRMTKDDVLTLLGIPVGVVRMKCALLSLKTLHKGTQEFLVNHGNHP